MKIFKIIALLTFLVSLFMSVDLGINCIGSLIPELKDGIAYNSILQNAFGLLEGSLRTTIDFFNAFKTSVWITFGILVVNVTLYLVSLQNK